MKKMILALGLTGALMTGSVWAEDSATATAAPAATATVAAATTDAPTTPAASITPPADATAAPAAADAAKPAPTIDHGDTAWMLTATLLVLMMTIPGLALFYGGMVRKKNVLGTMMHSLAAAAVVSLVWVVIGYSLAFGNGLDSLSSYIGGFDRVLLHGIKVDTIWTDAAGTAYTIPESLFMIFQMTFAIITVGIMAGAFAERMKFSAFLVFVALWVIAVYTPIAHWVWHAKGWLFVAGALDFAGGTVVHINSGIAGLVAAYVIGKRIGYGKEPMAPHNLVLSAIGAGLIWVGWFGFNAGSWLAADGRSAMAMVVTQIAAAAGCISWMTVERIARGKASILGGLSGAVAGLVAITPASGYVGPDAAIAIGFIAGAVCFWGISGLKRILGADDSLDAFGLHGLGGITGALLTAFFASNTITNGVPTVMPLGKQLLVQIESILATLLYSGIVTYVLLKIVDMVVGLRVSEDDEREGLDVSQHGERIE